MRTAPNPVEREAPVGRCKGGASFLFAWDLHRTWPSYAIAALLGAVYGFIASVLLEGIFVLEGFGNEGESMERAFNSFLLDFFFLAIAPAFLINFVFNRDYAARFTQDNMSRRLSFLRSLPVPARDLVLSRALSSLLSLVLSATPFFLTLYLLYDADGGRLPVEMYLPFTAIWAAYALVSGGFYLYVWLGFSGGKDLLITLSLMVLLLLVAGASNLALSVGLVSGSLELARDHGLAAVATLISGALVFALWMLAATRRLKRREL